MRSLDPILHAGTSSIHRRSNDNRHANVTAAGAPGLLLCLALWCGAGLFLYPGCVTAGRFVFLALLCSHAPT